MDTADQLELTIQHSLELGYPNNLSMFSFTATRLQEMGIYLYTAQEALWFHISYNIGE